MGIGDLCPKIGIEFINLCSWGALDYKPLEAPIECNLMADYTLPWLSQNSEYTGISQSRTTVALVLPLHKPFNSKPRTAPADF